MPAYEITAVAEKPREWKTRAGTEMLSFRVTLRNAEGNELAGVELSRKAGTKTPAAGDKVEGEVDRSGSYGPKLKEPQAQGSRGGGMFRPRDPAESRAIVRQHSQHMAVRTVALAASMGLLTKVSEPQELFDVIRKSTDWFVRDVEAARDQKPAPAAPQTEAQNRNTDTTNNDGGPA